MTDHKPNLKTNQHASCAESFQTIEIFCRSATRLPVDESRGGVGSGLRLAMDER